MEWIEYTVKIFGFKWRGRNLKTEEEETWFNIRFAITRTKPKLNVKNIKTPLNYLRAILFFHLCIFQTDVLLIYTKSKLSISFFSAAILYKKIKKNNLKIEIKWMRHIILIFMCQFYHHIIWFYPHSHWNVKAYI